MPERHKARAGREGGVEGAESGGQRGQRVPAGGGAPREARCPLGGGLSAVVGASPLAGASSRYPWGRPVVGDGPAQAHPAPDGHQHVFGRGVHGVRRGGRRGLLTGAGPRKGGGEGELAFPQGVGAGHQLANLLHQAVPVGGQLLVLLFLSGEVLTGPGVDGDLHGTAAPSGVGKAQPLGRSFGKIQGVWRGVVGIEDALFTAHPRGAGVAGGVGHRGGLDGDNRRPDGDGAGVGESTAD